KVDILLPNILRKVFKIDLVTDADARRNHAKAVERLCAPLEKLVTRAIASELDLHVLLERVACAGEVDLDRVIDHEIDGHEWFDKAGVFSKARHGGTHRREIDEQRNPCEILEQHARNDERNFFGAFAVRLPVGELAYVVFGDLFAVTISQHRLKDHAQAVRES